MTTRPSKNAALPLRVALFTETFLPKLDGVVTITCLLLNHFRQRGVEAMVFSPGEHPAEYNGYPIVSIPGVAFPMYPEATLSIPGGRTFERLKAFDPTIVHVINPWLSGLRGIAFAQKLDKPLVVSFHTHLMDIARFYHLGFIRPLAWQVHRHFYRKADYRLATSKRIQAELEAHGFGETGIWRRGVDSAIFSDKFRSEEMRSHLTGGQPDKTLLLFVGRVAAEKQIEQIRAVLENVPNTHLAIVGDGPNRPRLEQHFAGCPVTFAGYLKGAELSKAYASSDIFVFPSAIETFGLVVAEAMAAGLPVVSSRVGGVPELIESGVNGCIFEVNDEAQMIAYVRELADDPAKRAKMGAAARQTVLNLTWDKINDELLDDYRWIIEGHKLHKDF
jgi:glycosyltransferase involved in cell wall biosynthesis